MAKSKKAYKLDPRNARKHPERNKQAVESSLSELGAGRSIVVDADGFVIGGGGMRSMSKPCDSRYQFVK